jgi:putative transcriptional regulator
MKPKSRLLEAIHETAKDLNELGFIDKHAMNRYDALCIEPVQPYSTEQVRTLCDRNPLI